MRTWNRWIFTVIAIVIAFKMGLTIALVPLEEIRSNRPPNIVVFLADDLGYGDLSNSGHPTIDTPNIDKLRNEGIKLSNFYVQSLCTPTRGSVLTGRLPIRTGLYNPDQESPLTVFYPWSVGSLEANETTIAKALGQKGYVSAMIGKWHLGHVNALPTERGFDTFYGIPYSHGMGCSHGSDEKDKECPAIPEPVSTSPPVPLFDGTQIIQQPVDLTMLTAKLNQRATEFITKAEEAKRPFFLYYATPQPHIPLYSGPLFKNSSVRGHYGDTVQEMDDTIGVFVNHIEKLGLTDNTLFIFLSDNGPWKTQGENGGSSGLLFGEKGSSWEGGVRTAAYFKWPAVIKRQSINIASICQDVDIFSTVLDIARVSPPEGVPIDGISLLPILTGTGTINRTCRYYYHNGDIQATRCNQYKYHWAERGRPLETPLLYDVLKDPSEEKPLDLELYREIIDQIINQTNSFISSVIPGEPQLNLVGEVNTTVPCCNWNTFCDCSEL